MFTLKIAGVRLNNSNGSGTFLALALLSQLISSGNSFCTGPMMGGDVLASLRGTVPRHSRVATHSRAVQTAMVHMPFPAQLPQVDPLGWILDGMRVHAPILRSTTPVDKVNEGNEGRANAADLSSQLTLNYYFQHLRDKTKGLRFDEISECSSKKNLLLFAQEHSLGGVDAASDSSSVMYSQICQALVKKHSKASSGTGKFSVGSNTLTRIEPLEEYGKLQPMPISCQENVVALTQEVLEAYGIQPDRSLHFEIASILDAMGVPYATDFTIHNGKLYMDLMMTAADGGKILIMARDTSCFSHGTQETTSYIKMKSQSLRSIGYSVTAVPFFEWEKLTTKGQKVAYLAGKLSRHGFFGEGGGKSGESASRVRSIMRATRI